MHDYIYVSFPVKKGDLKRAIAGFTTYNICFIILDNSRSSAIKLSLSEDTVSGW